MDDVCALQSAAFLVLLNACVQAYGLNIHNSLAIRADMCIVLDTLRISSSQALSFREAGWLHVLGSLSVFQTQLYVLLPVFQNCVDLPVIVIYAIYQFYVYE